MYPGRADMLCPSVVGGFVPQADQCIAQDESLFDHLVGTDKKCRWYFEAQLLRGPEIEDSFVSSWSLDRKVHGLVAAQNAVDIPRRLAVMIEKVCLVGHRPPETTKSRNG